MQKLTPQYDRILFRLDKIEGVKTPAGLYLPESANEKHLTVTGTVLETGPGRMIDGHFLSPPVQPGDKILCGAHSYANIDEPFGYEDCGLIRFSDVLAVVEEVEEEIPQL